MTKTAIAKDNLETLERRTPAIDPDRVTLNYDGFAFRSFLVRVPADFVADDLKQPEAWSKVQASGRALRKFDQLVIVAFDEAWVAECMVASANGAGAVLAKPRLTTMPARYDKLFEDDLYRVAWMGSGYIVERKKDGHRMTQPTANPQLAERLLAQLYPARAAA